tara:strand:- start:1689 stop:2588 length:900 start_codon:yes stop_codon:yes gene_type:complete
MYMDDKKTMNAKATVWTKDHEKILIDWGDKAMCYKWLHAKSHNIYNRVNAYFTIPVIIMSTLTGTANFAQDRVPEHLRGYYSMGIGFVNIIAGIITTIQQFLKIAELNEAHRVSSISWDKFYRKIRVELSKPPEERQIIYDFLKSCTEEFDRLMETSPNIDKTVIELFNKTFNHSRLDDNKRQMFEQLKKPEICDALESVELALFKEDITEKQHTDFKKMVQDVVITINDNSDEYAKDKKMKLIKSFVENFNREMIRNPTKREIISNLQMEGVFTIEEALVVEYMENHMTTNENDNNIL